MSLRVYLLLPAGLVGAFIASAPWVVAGRRISRLTPVLVAAALLLILGALIPRWRPILREFAFERRYRFRSWTAALVFSGAAAFLLRVTISRYRALEVNAWDFSVHELPILATLKGAFLASPFDGNLLSVHANYWLLVFVPLYAMCASHYWLLAAQAIAVAAAALVAFVVCRRILQDDLAGLCFAIAFVLNTYTAKTVQYVFHIEVFYPLFLFLAIYGFLRRRAGLFFAAVVLTALVKEDAVLVLLGGAVAGLIFWRPRWWWWAVAGLIGVTAFVTDTYVVMPHFSGSSPGHPWYAAAWQAYGPTPLRAALGMVLQPVHVAKDLFRSGVKDLLETFGFLPLLGFDWFLAALPALVIYGVSAGGKGGTAQFSLYYSSPVLAFLLVAAAQGLARIGGLTTSATQRHLRIRVGALGLLLLCAVDGAGYTFSDPNPCRLDLASLRLPAARTVLVQGALLPHLPLDANALPLTRLSVNRREPQAVLLALDANPYPFSRAELVDLAERLRLAGFRITNTPHGLLLASPLASEPAAIP